MLGGGVTLMENFVDRFTTEIKKLMPSEDRVKFPIRVEALPERGDSAWIGGMVCLSLSLYMYVCMYVCVYVCSCVYLYVLSPALSEYRCLTRVCDIYMYTGVGRYPDRTGCLPKQMGVR